MSMLMVLVWSKHGVEHAATKTLIPPPREFFSQCRSVWQLRLDHGEVLRLKRDNLDKLIEIKKLLCGPRDETCYLQCGNGTRYVAPSSNSPHSSLKSPSPPSPPPLPIASSVPPYYRPPHHIRTT